MKCFPLVCTDQSMSQLIRSINTVEYTEQLNTCTLSDVLNHRLIIRTGAAGCFLDHVPIVLNESLRYLHCMAHGKSQPTLISMVSFSFPRNGPANHSKKNTHFSQSGKRAKFDFPRSNPHVLQLHEPFKLKQ